MVTGPIYFDGTHMPTQEQGGGQVPIIMDGADFEYWCCCEECLVEAYQQHRNALEQGDDTSQCITVGRIKNWLNSNYGRFIDHVNGPLTADSTEWLYFTVSTWHAAAGIDGTWKLGDLAKAFDALRWTLSVCDWDGEAKTADYYDFDPSSWDEWADAKAAIEGGWSADFDSDGFTPGAGTYGQKHEFGYSPGMYTKRCTNIVPYGSYGTLGHTGSRVYIKTALPTFPLVVDSIVYDDQGLGFQLGKWNDAAAAGGTVGTHDAPTWCDEPTTEQSKGRGYRTATNGLKMLVKWDFTSCK